MENPLCWKHFFCSRNSWRLKLNCLWCFSFLLNMKIKVPDISTSKLLEFISEKICHFENVPYWKHIFCIRNSWRQKLNYLWQFSFLQNMKTMFNSKVIALSIYQISQNFRKNPLFWEFPTHSGVTWWLKILLRP